MRLPSFLPAVVFLTTTVIKTARSNSNPILTSSFTWNPTCGPTVACGPSAAGFHGTGFAASNNLTYAGCNNLGAGGVDCSASNIASGVGKGCGQCWHITPQNNAFPSNGRSVGTSVVVKINDQCTDAGYCDQNEAHPVNTGYGKEIHIDLCADSGVTGQFFGAVGPGVLTGLAQLLPDCSALDNGPYGSGLGSLDASSSASSSSSSSAGGSSSSSNSAASSSSGGGSSSNSGSSSSSGSGSGSSSSSSSGSSSNSGSGSSSSSSSGSSSFSSGNIGTMAGEPNLPLGHDGRKAGAQVVGGASSVGSKAGSQDGSGTPSSSSIPAASPPRKSELPSGHDGRKAGAQVVGGASSVGSKAGSKDGSGTPSSSSSIPAASPPTPTTLVAVVSSSSSTRARAPASSSVDAGDDEDDVCDAEDFEEL